MVCSDERRGGKEGMQGAGPAGRRARLRSSPNQPTYAQTFPARRHPRLAAESQLLPSIHTVRLDMDCILVAADEAQSTTQKKGPLVRFDRQTKGRNAMKR